MRAADKTQQDTVWHSLPSAVFSRILYRFLFRSLCKMISIFIDETECAEIWRITETFRGWPVVMELFINFALGIVYRHPDPPNAIPLEAQGLRPFCDLQFNSRLEGYRVNLYKKMCEFLHFDCHFSHWFSSQISIPLPVIVLLTQDISF